MTRAWSPKSPTTACCVARLSQKPRSPACPVVADHELGLDRVVVEERRAAPRSRRGSSPVMWRREARVDEQRPLAGLGMRAHDGVLDRLERLVRLAVPLGAARHHRSARCRATLPVAELGARRRARRSASRGTPAAPGSAPRTRRPGWSSSVSPPDGGMTTALRIEPSGGRATKVTSVCQLTPATACGLRSP